MKLAKLKNSKDKLMLPKALEVNSLSAQCFQFSTLGDQGKLLGDQKDKETPKQMSKDIKIREKIDIAILDNIK